MLYAMPNRNRVATLLIFKLSRVIYTQLLILQLSALFRLPSFKLVVELHFVFYVFDHCSFIAKDYLRAARVSLLLNTLLYNVTCVH